VHVAEGRVTAVPDRRSASRSALFSANIAEAINRQDHSFSLPVPRCPVPIPVPTFSLWARGQIGVSEMFRALWKIEKNTRVHELVSHEA